MTDEVNVSTRIHRRYLFLENFGPISHATGGRHARDQNLGAIRFENLFNTAPMRHLNGGDGRPNGDKIKA